MSAGYPSGKKNILMVISSGGFCQRFKNFIAQKDKMCRLQFVSMILSYSVKPVRAEKNVTPV